MKILEITFHLQSGGAERFVVDLSNELSKNNEVTLLALRDDTIYPEIRNFYKDDVDPKVHYDCLHLKDGFNPIMWWKIWRTIHTHKPDVVHFHGDGMVYWMSVPMFFSSNQVKFVQTIHSSVIWGGYNKWIYRLVNRTLGRSGKLRYVAISQTNYHDFKAIFPGIISVCINNGRAPMLPSPKYNDVKEEINSFRVTNNTRIFLHVGRCCEVKNQTKLITCFNKLVGDGYDAQLLIIGEYYNNIELGKYLHSIAGPAIHFLGVKKNIADYQLNSDIFCLSSDSEGMPITLIEALLCGTPSVSTPVCGSIDAIQNGVNGYLSVGFSNDDYYDALINAISNWKSIKANAIDGKNITPYSIHKCALQYYSFFKELQC